MANTYTALYYHIVFSTKNRAPCIKPDFESRIWAYIGGIARAHDMLALKIGGMEEHIHALVAAPAALSPNEIAKYIKGDSSKWINREFPWPYPFGRMGSGHSRLASRSLQRSVVTLRTSANIIE